MAALMLASQGAVSYGDAMRMSEIDRRALLMSISDLTEEVMERAKSGT